MKKLLLYIFLFNLFLTVAGCGYHAGDILPAKTISVPIFQNKTLYRGYEFLLSKSVISQLMTSTPLHVTNTARAETMLTGTITEIRQKTVTKDEDRRATELDVNVTVEIEWKDLQNDKYILAKTRVSESMDVVVSIGETVENSITEALKKIARKIVSKMEHPYWDNL